MGIAEDVLGVMVMRLKPRAIFYLPGPESHEVEVLPVVSMLSEELPIMISGVANTSPGSNAGAVATYQAIHDDVQTLLQSRPKCLMLGEHIWLSTPCASYSSWHDWSGA